MRRRYRFAALCLVSVLSFAARPGLATACDGRYEGLVTVKGAQGLSVAPMQWTVREGKLYGAFEGPKGLFMVEATVNAACGIVAGAANDYDTSAPLPLVGTVTEGRFQHNGPVAVTYQMKRAE